MSASSEEFSACVYDPSGLRPFRGEDLPRIRGFVLFGQGFGDILCALPTIDEAIRQLGRPTEVWTFRPEIFRFHKKVHACALDPQALQKSVLRGHIYFVAPVGPVHERFHQHLIDHTARGILALAPDRKRIAFPSSPAIEARVAHRLAKLDASRKKIVIHPSEGVPVRSWPRDRWQALAESLAADHEVIAVGQQHDYSLEASGVAQKGAARLALRNSHFHDWVGTLSLHESYELIRAADLVICSDSGLLHLASATQTPIVAIFTNVDPQFRTRIGPDGNPGYRTIALHASCPMAFCASKNFENSERCWMAEKSPMCCLPGVEQVLDAAKTSLVTEARVHGE